MQMVQRHSNLSKLECRQRVKRRSHFTKLECKQSVKLHSNILSHLKCKHMAKKHSNLSKLESKQRVLRHSNFSKLKCVENMKKNSNRSMKGMSEEVRLGLASQQGTSKFDTTAACAKEVSMRKDQYGVIISEASVPFLMICHIDVLLMHN